MNTWKSVLLIIALSGAILINSNVAWAETKASANPGYEGISGATLIQSINFEDDCRITNDIWFYTEEFCTRIGHVQEPGKATVIRPYASETRTILRYDRVFGVGGMVILVLALVLVSQNLYIESIIYSILGYSILGATIFFVSVRPLPLLLPFAVFIITIWLIGMVIIFAKPNRKNKKLPLVVGSLSLVTMGILLWVS